MCIRDSSGAEYELRLPATASKRDGAKALRLCQDALDAVEVPAGSLGLSFRGALQQLATATYHGRAAVEAVWARDGRYLLTLRPGGTHLAGHWEFPGGKCEAGETHAEALRRELREELDIEAGVGALVPRAFCARSRR